MGVDPRSLQVGQAIVVREMNFGVQINLCGDGEAGLTVVEVTPEHLLLDDADGSTRRIPLYLINNSAPVPVDPVEDLEAA